VLFAVYAVWANRIVRVAKVAIRIFSGLFPVPSC